MLVPRKVICSLRKKHRLKKTTSTFCSPAIPMIHTSDSRLSGRSTTLSEANDLIFQARIRKHTLGDLSTPKRWAKGMRVFCTNQVINQESAIPDFRFFRWTWSCPCRCLYRCGCFFCTIDSRDQTSSQFSVPIVGIFGGLLSKSFWNWYPKN